MATLTGPSLEAAAVRVRMMATSWPPCARTQKLRSVRSVVKGRVVVGCVSMPLRQSEAADLPGEQALATLVAGYPPLAQLWNLVYVEPDVLGVPETSSRAEKGFTRIVGFVERGEGEGLLCKDMPPTRLASTFCGLAETAWELTLEGHMGTRRAPDFITAILLQGAAAEHHAER